MQVYMSRKWKFIFVRQPKSSSTAILHAISNQLCAVNDGDPECDPNEFKQVNSVEELDHEWQSYFVFTVVRNPWIRMLSAHTMFNKHFLFKCVLLASLSRCKNCLWRMHTNPLVPSWLL